MNSFVLNTILADSWFAAGLGYNHSVKPSRVSPPGGFRGTARVAGRYYDPPATDVRNAAFHYYHIGQMPTHFFGMFNVKPGLWYKVEDLINKNNQLINLVLTNGILLSPRPHGECQRYSPWRHWSPGNNATVSSRASVSPQGYR